MPSETHLEVSNSSPAGSTTRFSLATLQAGPKTACERTTRTLHRLLPHSPVMGPMGHPQACNGSLQQPQQQLLLLRRLPPPPGRAFAPLHHLGSRAAHLPLRAVVSLMPHLFSCRDPISCSSRPDWPPSRSWCGSCCACTHGMDTSRQEGLVWCSAKCSAV